MGPIVYLLCILTSLGCAWLLARGYRRSGSRLLFWSALCFLGLFLNNLLLFADLVLFPGLPLHAWRYPPMLFGIGLLVYGLVWETA